MSILINAYCTHRTPPRLGFPHELHGLRERDDPELAPHLEGFIGYVLSRGGDRMTRIKYHLMRHLQRVRRQVSVTVRIEHLDLFEEWAEQANAICFLPDGSVRDPFGRLLIDEEGGEPEEGAEIPYPPDAVARKGRSEQRLQRLSVKAPRSLPPVAGEVEVEMRPAGEAARRALALFLVALRAESLATDDGVPAAELRKRFPVGFAALSPAEAAFLKEEAPGKKQIAAFGWRYEALLALQWALGLVEELPDATHNCDVSLLSDVMMERGEDDLIVGALLRNPGAILDALDLHFRLHWAVRQARLDGTRPPGGIDGAVVQERHRVLNWLVRFEDAPWDDVDTPT